MLEILNPLRIRQEAVQFIDTYGTPSHRSIQTGISTFSQTDRPLAHLDRLFGKDLIPELNRLNAAGSFKVLDLPSGPLARNARDIILQYPNSHVTGIDLEIDDPTNTDQLTLLQKDLLDHPLQKESTDLVICYGFLDYLREKEMSDLIKDFFIKVGDTLKIGGVALIDFTPEYLDDITNRFKTPLSKVIQNQTGTKIASRSRNLPFGVRHPEVLNFRNLFTENHSVENNYVFITK